MDNAERRVGQEKVERRNHQGALLALGPVDSCNKGFNPFARRYGAHEAIAKRVSEYCEPHDTLPDEQCGTGPGHSTIYMQFVGRRL